MKSREKTNSLDASQRKRVTFSPEVLEKEEEKEKIAPPARLLTKEEIALEYQKLEARKREEEASHKKFVQDMQEINRLIEEIKNHRQNELLSSTPNPNTSSQQEQVNQLKNTNNKCIIS